ncbi:hypothetical protein H1P_460011 [Hyella patelloides LEGE 07179]|uniref:Uncharacterized protein n=1 Tax=Hyella patelloides LEGE 07179 TaxID=945734 RepID=A0A563VYR2_9CYAN|nr:hypothetical protein H1P_460011 [Hyella patelloides LEGE 07179]
MHFVTNGDLIFNFGILLVVSGSLLMYWKTDNVNKHCLQRDATGLIPIS